MSIEETRAKAHAVTVEILKQLAISEALEFGQWVLDHPEDFDGIISRVDELKADIRRYQQETSPF